MSYFSFLKKLNFFQRSKSTSCQEKQEISQFKRSINVNQSDVFSVLVADEKENTLKEIESLLKQSANSITLADGGIIAHTYLLLNQYDLVFLNPNLQCNNKDSIIVKARQENSRHSNTPIIAITDKIDISQRKTLIAMGFDDCLETPISIEQISEILNLWLPSSNMTRQIGIVSELYYVETMLKTTQGDKKIANTIFNKLFLELPVQIQAIEQDLALEQFQAAKDTVHKLHGSIIHCGFNDIQQTVQSLEISLEHEYVETIDTNFEDVKNKISDFINLKQTILNQLAL